MFSKTQNACNTHYAILLIISLKLYYFISLLLFIYWNILFLIINNQHKYRMIENTGLRITQNGQAKITWSLERNKINIAYTALCDINIAISLINFMNSLYCIYENSAVIGQSRYPLIGMSSIWGKPQTQQIFDFTWEILKTHVQTDLWWWIFPLRNLMRPEVNGVQTATLSTSS